jgi:hypothetical protein
VDGVAEPRSVEEVLDRPDRAEQCLEPAMVEVAERSGPARLGIDDPVEDAAEHHLETLP